MHGRRNITATKVTKNLNFCGQKGNELKIAVEHRNPTRMKVFIIV